MKKSLSILTILIYSHQFHLFSIVEAKPLEEMIRLRLYKKSDTTYSQAAISEAETLLQESNGYNASLPIVLMIHGIETGADCKLVDGLLDAFDKRQLTVKYNIFAVDMPEVFENSIRNQFYIGILANVQPAGDMIGRFLSNVVSLKLTTLENINIIGYSMGAQVAGYAARIVKNRFGEINFIAGLDPAGPGFHTRFKGLPTLVHVSAADARYTHFYHTNSVSCGTRDRVATADFVFNKGTVQPGCTKNSGLDCSHVRVPDLYIEAVINPKQFVARQCSSWEDFKNCDCNSHETVDITFPPETRAKGIYYLRTRSKSPFALGRRGSRCGKIVHAPQEKVGVVNTVLRDVPAHSKSSKIDQIKNLLHPNIPNHNFKENLNMHLIKGIRKLEDLHTSEVYQRLDPSSVEEARKTTASTHNQDKNTENKSHGEHEIDEIKSLG